LGAGFGSAMGFTGQLYGVRVWAVARNAEQIATCRWSTMVPLPSSLTVETSFDPDKQVIDNLVGGGTGSVSNGKVVTTDLPVPSWALSFSGTTGDGVSMSNISGLTTTAATFECWMKMSAAAGVAARAQTLIRQGISVQLTYAGGDKLSVTWLDSQCDSADTRPVSDGGWHHVAVVFDHGYVTLYKDGVATADSFQVPDGLPAGTGLLIGGGPDGAFDGELSDVRVWNCARTVSEVSSFRYATLQGSEPGLVALSGCGQEPFLSTLYVINQVNQEPAQMSGQVRVVPVPQAPLPQAPSPVWTYELAGEAPVGPVLTAQGLLCTDNNASGAGSAFLRSVDLQTGQVGWSYDVRAHSDQSSIVVPSAVGVYGQTALVGVQTTDKTQVEVHAVDVATGAPAWPKPAVVADVNNIITRPVVTGGTLYAGVQCDNFGTPGVIWGDAVTGGLNLNWATTQGVDAMTTPVTDGDNVYVGINFDGTAQVYAIPSDADGSNDFTTWDTGLDTPITADLTLGSSALFVPNGTTMLALDLDEPNSGYTMWSQQLSGSVNSQPVLLGSTLYAGCETGTLYALDAATGAVQWQVDTKSAISTGLASEDGVLYFATTGDDAFGPAFWAVDANSGGNDVLSYPVPGAGTIAFDQGGLANGVAYFYGTPQSSGANTVYAVSMSSVIHEFAVNSKLIVENYDTTTSTPAGSDTSYRVTLTIRDQNGMAQPQQAVKLWTTETMTVVNQASPVTLAPDSPAWMETDTSGNLTLALSAYDNGQPGGGTSGSPNLACPPLFAWASFMAAGEAIVIYPDHESLTQLSNVQGTTTTSADRAVQGSGTAA
ncbi:MAG: LamG-like jellyroll fold domain-containing protein, partial [Pseudonocardiaceae bacterium]